MEKTQLPALFDKQMWTPILGKKFFDHFLENDTQFDVDIIDTEKEIIVKCSIPGVTKENLNVVLKNNVLTISCERKEEIEERGKIFKKEISYGKLSRSFSIEEPVNEDTTKASFKDGILKIVLEKIRKDSFKKITIS